MSLTDAFAKLEDAFGELKKTVMEDDVSKKAKEPFGGKQAPPFGDKNKKKTSDEEEEEEDGKKPPFPPKKKKSLNDQFDEIEAIITAFGKSVEDDPIRKSVEKPGSMLIDGHPVIDAPSAGWPRDMVVKVAKRAEGEEDPRDFGRDPWHVVEKKTDAAAE